MSEPLKECQPYEWWRKKWGFPEKNEENYKSFKFDFGYRMVFLGFKDYMASRNLLLKQNSEYHLVGLVLASSAVEKYLKAYLCSLDYSVGLSHLNKLPRFINALKQAGKEGKYLLGKLDEEFLKLLADTYRFRYFGDTKHADGVLINQAIGELDFTVDLIESHLNFRLGDEGTEYQKAVNDKAHPIHENNFVLQYINRNEFMGKGSNYYAIRHVKDAAIVEITKFRPEEEINYKGHVSTVKIDY